MNRNSRIATGFHRLGVILAAPFLLAAIIIAVIQWRHPTGPLAMSLPVGTCFGDDLDHAGKQLLDEQRKLGLSAPNGMMIVGVPLGTVRRENADWTRVELFDGRKISIASIDSKRVDEIAKDFLLTERKKGGHQFTDKDVPIIIDGVGVTYLDPFDQFPVRHSVPPSPWLHQERHWTPTLIAFLIGLVAYIVARAIGWVINGFATGRGL